MNALLVVAGLLLVVLALADMVNTLVSTHTSLARWWPTNAMYRLLWRLVRRAVKGRSDSTRERVYARFAPSSVLLLLALWVVTQVTGFAALWLVADPPGVASGADAIYFSGVVYFTVGFGEIVPTGDMARVLALAEAAVGVLTTALVIGYLPSLYSAFASRERRLITLDDGTEGRITPTNLLISRTPGGDIRESLEFFAAWEEWVAELLETHTSYPMLMLFRSKYQGQHWVTALGVVTDAALIAQLIQGGNRQSPYWMLRRSIRLFSVLTEGADLSEWQQGDESLDAATRGLFTELYQQLVDHGFDVVPVDEAQAALRDLRSKYGPAMEYLIDMLDAPRGFWGHAIGSSAEIAGQRAVE